MVSATDTLPVFTPPAEKGPAWDVARLFPPQGKWAEGDYFTVSEMTNRLVELVDGHIEVLEMPGIDHHDVVMNLRDGLQAVVKPAKLGKVIVAPYPMRVAAGRFREPDVMFVSAARLSTIGPQHCEHADLVIEVLSPSNRDHDLVTKRQEYEAAGVAEYWIVDPERRQITVLTLREGKYAEHGVFGEGQTATSALLPAWRVEVAGVFAGA